MFCGNVEIHAGTVNSLDAMLVHICMHAYTDNRYEFLKSNCER